MPKPIAKTVSGANRAPMIVKQSPNAIPLTARGIVARIGNYWPESYMRLLMYGRSKTGKTRVWSTFPGPILAVVCSGCKDAGEFLSLSDEKRSKIKPVELYHSSELKELIRHLESKPGLYKTIVIDHVTGVQDKILAEILKVDKLPEQMSWGTASRDDYTECGTQCREYFRSFLNLKNNVILIGQEKEPKEKEKAEDGAWVDEELVLPRVGIDLMPKLAGWLYPAVDYICQTYIRPRTEQKMTLVAGKKTYTQERVGGYEYCLRVGPHDMFTTGFRLPEGAQMPDSIVNPTYPEIKQIMDGKWKPRVAASSK